MKLIIVCGEGLFSHGNYLQQLVSANDDEDGGIVGTKDGSVEAVVWNEQHFRDNAPKLMSSNRILFIGNSKLAKGVRKNMEDRYYAVGMHYGWLGNQAYMYVDDASLNRDNYVQFKALCERYGKSFDDELSLLYSPSDGGPRGGNGAGHGEGARRARGARTEPREKGPLDVIGGVVGGALDGAAKAVAAGGHAVVTGIGKAASKGIDSLQAGQMAEQQYSLLALILYMDGLAEFMEG